MLLGLNVSTSSSFDPVTYALLAERLGFDLVSASDHPCGTHPTRETWTMLTWIAARTSRIQVATRVLGVPYRNVAMVAKMAETLDRLSDGRLILGLGGGHSDEEFRGFGITVPTARDKIDGLEEAVRIVRGLWAERAFTFDGRLHRADRAELQPKPSRPIPIWLGTFGPRGLAVTGRLADGWIPSHGFAPPEVVPAMRRRVLDAAIEAGRDPTEITLAYNVTVHLGDDVTPGPGLVAGPPDAVVETLVGFAELGFTALNIAFPTENPGELAEQTEWLAAEVVPHVREAATR